MKFVPCEHIASANLALNGKGTQGVLNIGKHGCGVEACPVPRTGAFERGLKAVGSEMAEKGAKFCVRHKPSKARYYAIRTGHTVAKKADRAAAK